MQTANKTTGGALDDATKAQQNFQIGKSIGTKLDCLWHF